MRRETLTICRWLTDKDTERKTIVGDVDVTTNVTLQVMVSRALLCPLRKFVARVLIMVIFLKSHFKDLKRGAIKRWHVVSIVWTSLRRRRRLLKDIFHLTFNLVAGGDKSFYDIHFIINTLEDHFSHLDL